MSFAFYLIICVFIVGYMCIALEHPLKVNKAATALFLCFMLWTIFAFAGTGAMTPEFAAKIGSEDIHTFITEHFLRDFQSVS